MGSKHFLIPAVLLFSIVFSLPSEIISAPSKKDNRKEATQATIANNKKVKQYLPFGNKKDFQDAKRGFIGTSNGSMAFKAVNEGKSPDTVNPSLWRQAQLNNIAGLFEVMPGIYQIRGFDLANISFIKGKKGWIVVDPLTSTESAKKALALFRKYKGNAPITGVIFTHSHADHFGGVKGILSEKEIKAGVPIVAPENFLKESISENLLAGNAMTRRSSYMYGSLLPKDTKGTIDAGLGKGVSSGTFTIAKPTKSIKKSGEKYTIDGVDFEFLMAQNTEAPAEFIFYMPQYKAASSAEVINHTLHNISTLRGAKTRDSTKWVDAINNAQGFLANRTNVMFGSHHWPTWEQKNVDSMLKKQAALYQFIHDQTLRLANMGYTPIEIAEQIVLPDSLGKEFYNRGYYGTMNHNVKAVYDFYFGAWWDGNPANLYKLPPVEAGKHYVQYMGGEDKVVDMAKKSYDKGEYRWVVEVLNNVIFANPKNKKARDLSADAMEQLGYQSESAVWRAYFLTGASELRNGIQKLPTPQTFSPDIIENLSVEQFLDYLAIRLNPDKVKNRTINVDFMIEGKPFEVTIENSVLTYKQKKAKNADFSIVSSRNNLNKLLLKQIKTEDAFKVMKISNKQQFEQFMNMFDNFEFWFPIVTP